MKPIELLAPGGDVDSIKAAILAGANAVYCGLDKFNARNRATNISFNDLQGIIRLAHTNNCQVFLTLNIIIVESEIPSVFGLLNKLINTQIDGIIVQDLGLFYIISKNFERLSIHASTQVTTHNEGQILFLKKLNTKRVNFSRELNIKEIEHLSKVCSEHNIESEVFVHGSNCLCFSGICYMSSVQSGNSGNRGRCSQPCRDQYATTAMGKDFPLNIKDNSAFSNISELINAGVDSFKIEGRIKKSHYVYTVVDAWRKQLDRFYIGENIVDKSQLFKVFNRGFSNAFLTGNISSDMFIDNPRDNSAIHLNEISDSNIEKAKGLIYDERTEIIQTLQQKLTQLNIEKSPLTIIISGEYNSLLKVTIKSKEFTFDVFSETQLSNCGNQTLSLELFNARFKSINDTEFYIKEIQVENLQPNCFLAFSELTRIKRQILFHLIGSKDFVDPITITSIMNSESQISKPKLSVLLSSFNDLYLLEQSSSIFYFQIPNSIKSNYDELVLIFSKHKSLIPYFPSILIGEDYNYAIELINKIKPNRIVTNNTGIAYYAYECEIKWIAGPYLNIVNSYSLICLKEYFNCSGAFISNELSKVQIKAIKKPENFDLFYSMYYPIQLMTSRQCLFHQVSGCEKMMIDETCILNCEKYASITNSKNDNFKIVKTKGNYHTIYDETRFLNIDIVNDITNMFSGFLIDLTRNEIVSRIDKSTISNHFENFLKGKLDLKKIIEKELQPTTIEQYKKGI